MNFQIEYDRLADAVERLLDHIEPTANEYSIEIEGPDGTEIIILPEPITEALDTISEVLYGGNADLED